MLQYSEDGGLSARAAASTTTAEERTECARSGEFLFHGYGSRLPPGYCRVSLRCRVAADGALRPLLPPPSPHRALEDGGEHAILRAVSFLIVQVPVGS